MSELKTVIEKFIERDKNAVDDFNAMYGWGTSATNEARIAFVNDRLLDAISVLVYLAKHIESKETQP